MEGWNEEALAAKTKTELQGIAVDLDIKQPGIGWPKCCPPKGAKMDIIRAILAHVETEAGTKEHEEHGEHGEAGDPHVDRGEAEVRQGVPVEEQAGEHQGQEKDGSGTELKDRGEEEADVARALHAGGFHGTTTSGSSLLQTSSSAKANSLSAEEEHALIHKAMVNARSTFTADFSDQDLAFFPRTLGYGVSWLTDPVPVALLQSVVLDRNELRSLPEELACLLQLRRVSVKHNHLQSLPDTLHKLPHLQALDVSHNELQALPDTLTKCHRLQVLNLDDNHLETLPEEMGSLKNLRELGIGSQPRLRSLPISLWRLANTLTALWFRDTPNLEGISPALLRDKEKLFAFLQKQDPNADTLRTMFADISLSPVARVGKHASTSAPTPFEPLVPLVLHQPLSSHHTPEHSRPPHQRQLESTSTGDFTHGKSVMAATAAATTTSSQQGTRPRSHLLQPDYGEAALAHTHVTASPQATTTDTRAPMPEPTTPTASSHQGTARTGSRSRTAVHSTPGRREFSPLPPGARDRARQLFETREILRTPPRNNQRHQQQRERQHQDHQHKQQQQPDNGLLSSQSSLSRTPVSPFHPERQRRLEQSQPAHSNNRGGGGGSGVGSDGPAAFVSALSKGKLASPSSARERINPRLEKSTVFAVIDTCVALNPNDVVLLLDLLNNHRSLVVIVPRVVMKELEHRKEESSERGYNARSFIRFLRRRIEKQDPQVQVQRIQDRVFERWEQRQLTNDHRIMECALFAKTTLARPKVDKAILLTSDQGLQVAARTEGLTAVTVHEFTQRMQDLLAQSSNVASHPSMHTALLRRPQGPQLQPQLQRQKQYVRQQTDHSQRQGALRSRQRRGRSRSTRRGYRRREGAPDYTQPR